MNDCPIELQLILKSQGNSKRKINAIMNQLVNDDQKRKEARLSNLRFKAKLEHIKFKEATQEPVYRDVFGN